MSRRHFGPIKTYKIVASGASHSVGVPGESGAMGPSAFVVAVWWLLAGVPDGAVPPE